MKDLTTGPEGKLILHFAVPMLIGNVFQQSYSIVDSVIVGRAIGKSALAAVGASFPILFLLIALSIGVTMGFSILISQYFGAKNMRQVRSAIDTSLVFTFCASLVIMAAGLPLCRPALELLKTPPELLAQGTVYLQITFGGMPFIFGFATISAILRGLGDSKTPLYFLMVSTVLNVVLVAFFVLACHWGIAGSAWATVIAQGVSCVMGMAYLSRSHKVVKPRWRGIVFDLKIFQKSLAIGLPTGVQQVFVALGMMALTRIVNAFGTDAIAAFTAASRLDAFAVLPAMNLSAAVSTFTGQNLGAGKLERVKHGLKAALLISGFFSAATTLAVVGFGKPLVALFNADPHVVAIGARYLLIVGGFYVIFSSMFVVSGVLRGAGDTMIPMVITILALWLVRVPIAAWLSGRIGTDGIWWSVPIAWAVGLALSAGYYATGRWKTRAAVPMPAPMPALMAVPRQMEEAA
ncbi:MAG TPA: MATE family efflux transporter [Elusimicrobia bacterium]|nr:MATE family efflux transporter [Elusimicrobiota bacterium]